MRKQGFTLIEVLAVLILIGLLSAIAFTSINGVLERQRNKEYKSKCDLFLIKAEDYLNDNKNDIVFLDSEPEFTLEILISNGYVSDKIINPKTNEIFDEEETFFDITKSGNIYYINKDIEYKDWCK